MKKKYMILLSALSLASSTFAQTWIWYPGDYEIWLGNQMNNRRTERGAFFPPFWKTDSHYVVVEFSKQLNLSEPEEIFIAAEGKYNVKLDGKLQFGMPETMLLPAGKHNLNIKVWNQATPPTIYVKGKTVNSDSSWRVTYEDKEWIDESGKASDTSATIYMDAGCWNFDGATQRPSQFSLMREPQQPVTKTEQSEGGILYDFGKETFGFITLKNLSGKGKIEIYYGESPEEAKDKAYCETLDKLLLEPGQVTDLAIRSTSPLSNSENEYTLENSKAFRYVYVTHEPGVQIGEVSMQYEYLPEEYRGNFRCNDEELNRIWEVGAYTMHLTTREFFIDGIKRDRLNDPNSIELELLSNFVADYSEEHFSLGEPSLVDVLKLRMYEMGLNQKSLSQLIGVSPSRLSDYISGKCEPTLKVAREISKKLNIDASIVLGV